VFADHVDRVLQVLDEAECLDLLSTAAIGRVAFTEGALPAIQPVSFRLDGGEIFIPTRSGSEVAAASRGAVLAFEVDEVQVTDRTGWNVTVVGPSRVISDPADVAALDDSGPESWMPVADRCYIAIAVQLVRGRRVGPRAPVSASTSSGVVGTPSTEADVPA
jgi:hypothetical protein